MSAQQVAEGASLPESEWRAFLIAGRAHQKLGDYATARDLLLRADRLLSSLQQRWGEKSFADYRARRDVETYVRLLREAAAKSK